MSGYSSHLLCHEDRYLIPGDPAVIEDNGVVRLMDADPGSTAGQIKGTAILRYGEDQLSSGIILLRIGMVECMLIHNIN